MRKKGFTLIELLAVIVILAIIALIATPMILGVIDSAKKGAVQSSAYGILEAAETYYGTASLGGTPQTSFDLKTDTLLSYKGKRPERGELYIRSDGKMSIALVQDGWCAIKRFEDKSVQVSKTTNCVTGEQPKEYAVGEELMFGDEQKYNVIAVGTDTVTLLKQESIGNMPFDNGREVTETDYCNGHIPNHPSNLYQCNAYQASSNFVNGSLSGPVQNNSTLYDYLNNEWVKTLPYQNIVVGDILLITKEQYESLGGSRVSWLNNGTVFWTMSPCYGEAESRENVISVSSSGSLLNREGQEYVYPYSTSVGVRPVITVKKSELQNWIKNEDLNCVIFNQETGTLEPNWRPGICAKNLIIPKTIYGVEVKAIGESAFRFKGLESVSIPDSVKTIGSMAFSDNLLTDVVIPSSVTLIDEVAFLNNQLPDEQAFIYNRNPDGSEDKTSLNSYGGAKKEGVKLPSTIQTIPPGAFMQMELISVELPEGITTIGESAFFGNSLTSITIPRSVMTIGDQAFDRNQLTRVVIKGKSSSTDFTIYGADIWGWASGYNETNLSWAP